MRRFWSLPIIAALLLVAGGGLVWWTHFSPLSLTVVRTERDVEVRLFGIGTVEAQVSSRLGFQVAGRIVHLGADQGQILEAGKVIALLDSDVQNARVQKALVAVQQSETALLRAQALRARAQVNHVQKQAIAERRQALVERGAATREATDEALTQAEIAKADLQVAEAEVSVAMVARKDVAASAAIEQAILGQHALKTPFKSRIIARLKEAGSIVNPAEPVFSIVAPETVWVRAFIDEAMAGSLKLGQTAYVRLRSDPSRVVEAEVVRIDEENDRVTEERRIYVRCRNCSPEHLGRNLGEQAEVEVLTRRIESGVFVPLYAVGRYDNRSGVVWVVENGRLAKRTLALADRLLDGRVLVAEPLPAGVSIVAERNLSGLREGRSVRADLRP